ncbi:MAG: RagB/SusD family nutrient uptake outer membrane protein [Bacteroidia bacterium]|nr:MAG: RagB/SusD family nutrient uptake outer membrane protein [Bacteroidia bacterium]
MKMNNKLLTLVTLLAFNITGCSDYLEETNPSEVTTEFLYTTEAGLKNAVTGLYALERDQVDDSESTYFALIQGDGGTDIDFIRAAVSSNVARYRLDVDLAGEAAIRSWWRKWYTIIERTNSIITYGSAADIPQESKALFLREAYVHRANAYFWLIRKYDNIWLNTEPTTYENVSNREYGVATIEEVYDLIISDLDLAISYYGNDWSAIAGQFGLGAALFLRTNVALWQGDWATAGDLAERIINEGTYALVEPSDIFTKDGRNSSRETIYALQLDEFAIGGGNAHRFPLTFTTQYRKVPGMVNVAEFGGYGWGRISPNEYLLSLYNPDFDKRWDAWFQHYYTYNDQSYDFSSLPYKLGDTLVANQNSSLTPSNFYANACVSVKKYFDFQKDPEVRISYNNVIMYRFAEVYLMAAEAFFKDGQTDKAVYYFNLLRLNRIRPGAPGRVKFTITTNDILEEYARELAFEGRRWFILKRFGVLVDRVRLYGGQSSFRGIPSPSPDYYSARTNIQDYHVRWPIPQSELDAMGGIFPQNEGYVQ